MSRWKAIWSPSWLAFALPLIGLAIFFVLVSEPAPRIGDGMEYLLMTMSICEKGQTYADQEIAVVYEAFRNARGSGYLSYAELAPAFENLTRNGETDFPHFWFYSLLAAPYYLFLKLVGGDVAYCFVLLNLTLFGVLLSVAHSQFGKTGAAVAAAICLVSPALWFLDKGHTEFFTVAIGSVAVIYFLKKKYVKSFVAFSCIGTQNPPLAIIGVLVLVFGAWENRFVEGRWKKLRLCLPGMLFGVVITALHPVYYYVRFGNITPQMITGAASSEYKGFRALTCFVIDPDVGLVSNWPWLLIPLVAVPAYGLIRRQPVNWWVLGFCSISVFLLCWAQAKTNNFNHGGTIKISRYALWYIPFLFPLLFRFASNYRHVSQVQRIACLAFLSVAIYVNGGKFWPARGESYLFQTTIAEAVYDHFPGVYDPMPEIFIERNVRQECPTDHWAVSNRSGSKIIVHSGRLRIQQRKLRRNLALDPVAGCKWTIDARKFLEMINSAEMIPETEVDLNGEPVWKWFYVNGPGEIFSLEQGGPASDLAQGTDSRTGKRRIR